MRRLVLVLTAILLAPSGASAMLLDDAESGLASQVLSGADSGHSVTQGNNGKTLSQAVEQVRRQTGGRILSAETRMQGDREVHHIKVLTKDGKVRTHKVNGRRR